LQEKEGKNMTFKQPSSQIFFYAYNLLPLICTYFLYKGRVHGLPNNLTASPSAFLYLSSNVHSGVHSGIDNKSLRLRHQPMLSMRALHHAHGYRPHALHTKGTVQTPDHLENRLRGQKESVL
jgi:hypothetical protein